MARRPRSASAPLLSPFVLWRSLLVSVVMAALACRLFFYMLDHSRSIETARMLVVKMLSSQISSTCSTCGISKCVR